MMLQWTGGSRRKVATSRKSTHTRQKQYFEQRKRQKQATGLENCANRSDNQAHNAEPRSLDILNFINLAVASQPASTEPTASVDSLVAPISDDSLLEKVTGSYSTVAETRLQQAKNSSDSILPEVRQTDSYKCVSQVNKCKMPGSITEHTSIWKDDTFNEKKETLQFEATVLDLLGDGEPCSNARSIPETHVALSVEGLGKIGGQTPAHSPRIQNRFSCKGLSMASKASKQVRSTSAQCTAHNDCNKELNVMIDDFRISPLYNDGGTWAYNGAKTTRKSRITPVTPYSREDEVEEISIKAKAYAFLNSTKKFENFEASDLGIRDTFLCSSRNLWEGSEIFEASATSTPHFSHSTSEKEGNLSFIWERYIHNVLTCSCSAILLMLAVRCFSDDTNADGMFKRPSWSFLSTEDFQDYTSILSEDLNSSTAVRKKKSLDFETHSTRHWENKRNSSDKFQMYSDERDFMGIFSQEDNIFPCFDDAVWGKKDNGNSAVEKSVVDNLFLPGQVFSPDPFNSFTMKSFASSGYETMFQDDHFDPFPAPKSNFKIPSECEPTSDFINQNEMFRKKIAFEFDSHTPMKPSAEAKSLRQYSASGGDFFKDIHFTHLPKYQEYNEDRGSSGKPQPKDYEKKSTSSGNAESVAGVETLSKISEHEESKNETTDPSDDRRVENSIEQTEVIPTVMEELPTQIQSYVHSKLNQFLGRSPVPSHPSNEESKATFEPEIKEVHGECGGNGDASYQVMLQSYVLQLLCVQKVLLEASGKDIKKKGWWAHLFQMFKKIILIHTHGSWIIFISLNVERGLF